MVLSLAPVKKAALEARITCRSAINGMVKASSSTSSRDVSLKSYLVTANSRRSSGTHLRKT
ncbi:hypothetical protein D3C72_2179900 [compost metagenome]